MKCDVVENRIVILQDELDIYDAPTLREKISSVVTQNNHSVVLDLHMVESISTPVIQVLMAAKKGIKGLEVLNINERVNINLWLFGFSL